MTGMNESVAFIYSIKLLFLLTFNGGSKESYNTLKNVLARFVPRRADAKTTTITKVSTGNKPIFVITRCGKGTKQENSKGANHSSGVRKTEWCA